MIVIDFFKSQPPKFADNQGKTIAESRDEDLDRGAEQEKIAAKSEHLGNGLDFSNFSGGTVSAAQLIQLPLSLMAGLYSAGAEGLGQLFRGTSPLADFKKHMIMYAESLNPEEKRILLESINKGSLTNEALKTFSFGRIMNELGLARYVTDINPADYLNGEKVLAPDPDGLFLPLHIVLLEKDRESDLETMLGLYKGRRIRLFTKKNDLPGVAKILIADKEFFDELHGLSGAERIRRIAQVISAFNDDLMQKLEFDQQHFTNHAKEFLTALTSEESGSVYTIDLQLVIASFDRLSSNLQHAYTPSKDIRGRGWGMSPFSQPLDLAVSQGLLKQRQVFGSLIQSVSALSHTLIDDPIQTLRWYERYGQTFRVQNSRKETILDRTTEVFSRLSFALDSLIVMMKYDATMQTSPYIKEWSYRSQGNVLGGILLVNILTDRDYFFTVAPERDEIPAFRPYFPLTVHDPRVQRRQVPRGPISVEKENYIDVFIECEDRADCKNEVLQSGSGKNGQDFDKKEGAIQGHSDANRLNGNSGDSIVSNKGFIREESLGREASGHLALKHPLSKRVAQYPPLESAKSVRHGSVQDLRSTFSPRSVDERTEVHLKPETWSWLLTMASPSSVMIEPIAKVLLHHTFRKKLIPIWKDYHEISNLQSL